MTCTIVQKGLGTALSFYHHLRRKGYAHGSAVVSVLMYYSPSKGDLHERLSRRRRYLDRRTYCTCCGRRTVGLFYCRCGKLICQDCMPPFGAHVCEPE